MLELGAGVIQQDDALEALVARRVAPGAGAELEQEPAAGGQQSAQGDGFYLVFVAAVALIPEGGLVVGAFVVADGGEGREEFTGNIIRLRGIHRKAAMGAKENKGGQVRRPDKEKKNWEVWWELKRGFDEFGAGPSTALTPS